MSSFHASWKDFLEQEFRQDYFLELSKFLHLEYENKKIFPRKDQVFRAFSTDFNKIKVVILGQDPYHTPGVADGLAFSVKNGREYLPPSLVNIYKEIDSDVGKRNSRNGDLTSWAEQGVLLLNNVLTVEAHLARSHRGRGWETFTRHCVEHLSKNREHLVFILWGRDAREKKSLIDEKKHFDFRISTPVATFCLSGIFWFKTVFEDK